MAFWSTERIREEQKKHKLIDEDHYKETRVKNGAYELGLSKDVLTTPDGITNEHQTAGSGAALRIPPGQFALLYTQEHVNIPNSAIAFLSLKGGVKFKGLINISGFQVDPGFPGRLKFSVYNAGSETVYLNYGEPCFLIWFADLDRETKFPYVGEHKNQSGFTAEDRERFARPNLSPAGLQREVNKLKRRLKFIETAGGTIVLGVFLPIFVGLILLLVDHLTKSEPDKSSKPVSEVRTNVYFVMPSNPSATPVTPAPGTQITPNQTNSGTSGRTNP